MALWWRHDNKLSRLPNLEVGRTCNSVPATGRITLPANSLTIHAVGRTPRNHGRRRRVRRHRRVRLNSITDNSDSVAGDLVPSASVAKDHATGNVNANARHLGHYAGVQS